MTRFDYPTESLRNGYIIDELWPLGTEYTPVESKLRGSCIRCGRCCALIRIPVDADYMASKIAQYDDWYRNGMSAAVKRQNKKNPEWRREYLFLLNNWRKVPRITAVRRGFTKDVDRYEYFFTCKLLKEGPRDLWSCKAHNRWRPRICTGYPHYENKDPHDTPDVHVGCGFARKRPRKKKPVIAVTGEEEAKE